ncbi:MAG: phosphate signaling complex protein PhoU [Erysipelotrichaceae bacterium]
MVIKMDKSLKAMETSVYKMGDKVIAQHELVCELIRNNDSDLALKIISSDDFINHMEEEINDQAFSCIALLSPVATDLRRVIVAIKIAGDLERIGDYAKNIAMYLIKHQPDDYIVDYAEQMMKYFLDMIKDVMKAYKSRDVDLAFSIPERDKNIDTLFNELGTKLKNLDDIDRMKKIFSLTSMLRSIERSGDHTTNICEEVIYLIKGQHYDFG